MSVQGTCEKRSWVKPAMYLILEASNTTTIQGTPSYTRKQSEGAMEHFRYEVSFENITTQVAWENISANANIIFFSLQNIIWPSFSGGWVHSDYFNRAERSNGDTNRGEVSNGSNIAQLNLTQPDTTYGPIPAWFLKPLLLLEVKKTLFC